MLNPEGLISLIDPRPVAAFLDLAVHGTRGLMALMILVGAVLVVLLLAIRMVVTKENAEVHFQVRALGLDLRVRVWSHSQDEES